MKTPSTPKTKGEQLLERGVWYEIKGKAQHLLDTTLKILGDKLGNGDQSSKADQRQPAGDCSRVRGGSVPRLSRFNLSRNKSKQTQEIIFQIRSNKVKQPNQ